MPRNDKLIDAMASVKRDVHKRMDAAVAAILALAWKYRGEDFSFEAHEDTDAEVNKILAAMSDGNLADAEARAKRLLEDLELEEYEEEALEYAEGEIEGQDALHRLDTHAWHLKDLLAGWLVVAGLASLSRQQTIQSLYAHLGNPMASRDWREAGLSAAKWGTGYAKNVLNGMTVIGQNVINTAAQYAEYRSVVEKGAAYFIRHRGSGYDCPWCDSYCERKIPIEQIIYQTHTRCVCWNEYFTADGMKIEITR